MTPTDPILATSTALPETEASSLSAVATPTPQDVYRAFVQDTSSGASIIHIGEAFIVFGILMFCLFFIARFSYARNASIHHAFTRNIAIVLSIVGVSLVGFGLYATSEGMYIHSVFSAANVSEAIWESYKSTYLEESSGRTIDPARARSTTSEGESYTMLRAVWMDDQETFDQSWRWTRENLQRTDGLFSWIYGVRSDGSLGILTEIDGDNAASDADTDIALSLIFAYARWGDPEYLAAAQRIIGAIWEEEVVYVGDTPYLAANNVEKDADKETFIINPSYFAPYAYRIFAQVDPAHPWDTLVDSSYDILEKSISSPLDAHTSAGLPPDWIQVDKTTGSIRALDASSTHTTNYSYDAMRVPWRIALDWKWNTEPRAQMILDRMSFLGNEWESRGILYAAYRHDGAAHALYEAPALYGGSIGFFIVSDAQQAHEIYRKKLLILFDPDTNTWRVPLSYYDANWVWFGMALYNDQLPEFASDITTLSMQF